MLGEAVMPRPWSAPLALLILPGNCGPVSAWMVLRRFRKRVASARIIDVCRYSPAVGCYAIGLAVGLRELGLHTVFCTDHDPSPARREEDLYKRAHRLGIPIRPAIDLRDVRQLLKENAIIAAFAETGGVGHLSPLTGVNWGRVILPYSERGYLSLEEFEKSWSAPDHARQCVLVRRLGPGKASGREWESDVRN